MTYKEFDKKYNKRDYRGVVTRTSVINLDGDIIAQGTVEEMCEFMDDKCYPEWKDRKLLGHFFEGQKVEMTNIGNGDTYARYFVTKLNFEVTF